MSHRARSVVFTLCLFIAACLFCWWTTSAQAVVVQNGKKASKPSLPYYQLGLIGTTPGQNICVGADGFLTGSGCAAGTSAFPLVLNAAAQAGANISAQIAAATTACNLTYQPSVGISSGCTVQVPPKSDGSCYSTSATITIPGLSYAPYKLQVLPGACIHYTGTGWAVDANGVTNLSNVTIENLTLVGNASALGGVRIGPGAGQHIINPYIVGFPATGAACIQFAGSDTSDLTGGTLVGCYDGIQFEQANTGPATGANPNAVTVSTVHIYGSTHHQINGEHMGNGDRLLDITIEGPATGVQEVCGYFAEYNHLTIERTYCEGAVPGSTGSAPYSYGWVFAGGSTLNYVANWNALTNAHAVMNLTATHSTIYSMMNHTGGAEPAYVDATAGPGPLTIISVGDNSTGTAFGLNTANAQMLKIGSGFASDGPDPYTITIDQFGTGLLMNEIVAPPSGLVTKCDAGAGVNAQVWRGTGFGTANVAGVDCSGVFSSGGNAGYTGTCASGHSLVVTGGIVTGCS